jgi:hypothetical protein
LPTHSIDIGATLSLVAAIGVAAGIGEHADNQTATTAAPSQH